MVIPLAETASYSCNYRWWKQWSRKQATFEFGAQVHGQSVETPWRWSTRHAKLKKAGAEVTEHVCYYVWNGNNGWTWSWISHIWYMAGAVVLPDLDMILDLAFQSIVARADHSLSHGLSQQCVCYYVILLCWTECVVLCLIHACLSRLCPYARVHVCPLSA